MRGPHPPYQPGTSDRLFSRPGSEARKHQGARITVRAWIWPGGIEVRVLIRARCRRQRELVSQTVVERKLPRDAPVVLRIKAVVRVVLIDERMVSVRPRIASPRSMDANALPPLPDVVPPGTPVL